MRRKLPDAHTLRALIDYDASSGVLTWRSRTADQFDCTNRCPEWQCRIWNARYAGKPAGRLSEDGYVKVRLFKKLYQAHQLAWKITHGSDPSRLIDHVNGDRGDNRLLNLREADESLNARNAFLDTRNTSGFPGVTWDTRINRWVVQIYVRGRSKYLGSRAELSAAIELRRSEQIKHGFSERHGEPRKVAVHRT